MIDSLGEAGYTALIGLCAMWQLYLETSAPLFSLLLLRVAIGLPSAFSVLLLRGAIGLPSALASGYIGHGPLSLGGGALFLGCRTSGKGRSLTGSFDGEGATLLRFDGEGAYWYELRPW